MSNGMTRLVPRLCCWPVRWSAATGAGLPVTPAGCLSWGELQPLKTDWCWERRLLEGLEAVSWVALGHAHGSAEDVPQLLR